MNRKRQARALQTLTGQPYRTVLNAMDNDRVGKLSDNPLVSRAAICLVDGNPTPAIAHLTAQMLTERGFEATTTLFDDVKLQTGTDVFTISFDVGDVTTMVVLDAAGHGLELDTNIPAPISDPLAVAQRACERLDGLAVLWDEAAV